MNEPQIVPVFTRLLGFGANGEAVFAIAIGSDLQILRVQAL